MKRTKPKSKRKYKRPGRVTKKEQAIVTALVKEAPDTPTVDQTKALAKLFNRPTDTVKSMLVKAKASLAGDAQFYVDTHKEVVATAMAVAASTGSEKHLDIARKGSAWAIANISGDGKRLVEKADIGPQGTRIMVGVKLSNTTIQPEVCIDVSPDAIDAEVDE
jgi:hypothetical protein